MITPDFIIGGAQKAGTTSLFYILQHHPNISLPHHEETHFFDIEQNYRKGLEFYDDLFQGRQKVNTVIGDFTANYLLMDYIPERIYKTIGSYIKILFILRNPVDRAYSHFLMNVRNQIETLPFKKALDIETKRLSNCTVEELKYFSYIERGLYAKQLKNYLAYFKENNIKIVLFEDLFGKEQQQKLAEIQNFIGVSYQSLETDFKKFQAGLPRFPFLGKLLTTNNKRLATFRKNMPLPPVLRQYLRKLMLKKPDNLSNETKRDIFQRYFLEDTKELSSLLQKDMIEYWKFHNL